MADGQNFVVMQECAEGNERVGTEWIEAKAFPGTTTLAEVWAWRVKVGKNGRTMLTAENDRA